MEHTFQTNINDFLPLRDVVLNTLRQAILTGELKPGERLMEIHLADKMGVSRTPIREAIRRLELDAFCAELACDRITEEELKNLELACRHFENAVKTKDSRKIAQADVALHDIIVQATGNQRLLQLINDLSQQMYRYRFEYIKDSSQHERLVEEHKIIYQSILNKDKATAAHAAKVHIDNQEKAIIQQIRLERQKNKSK